MRSAGGRVDVRERVSSQREFEQVERQRAVGGQRRVEWIGERECSADESFFVGMEGVECVAGRAPIEADEIGIKRQGRDWRQQQAVRAI